MCLLFLPWRSEIVDIENQNWQKLYEENMTIIRQNQAVYVTITDEEIDELFKCIKVDDDGDNELREHLQEQSEDVDILAQSGIAKPKAQNITNRFFSPQKYPLEILPSLEKLNYAFCMC